MDAAERLALDFVEKINAHDIEALASLMSEAHEFTDSLGSKTKGREAMKQAWIGYFQLVPDYRIEIEQVFRRESRVALFGFAAGTYAPGGELSAENGWRIPAAWLATVKDGRVARWQVFADNKPMHDRMSRE